MLEFKSLLSILTPLNWSLLCFHGHVRIYALATVQKKVIVKELSPGFSPPAAGFKRKWQPLLHSL